MSDSASPPSDSRRRSFGVGCLVWAIFGLLVLAWFFHMLFGDYCRKLWEMDCGADRSIAIGMYYFEDGGYPVYSVRDRGRLTVSNHVVYLGNPIAQGDALRTASSKNGMIWGIVDNRNPYEFIILHDFGSDESYPRDEVGGLRERASSDAARMRLRVRLEHDCPEFSLQSMLTNDAFMREQYSLDLSHRAVTREQLLVLTNYPKIQTIDLSNSTFSDADMVLFRTLDQMKTITLVNCGVTASGLKQLEASSKLSSLNIGGGRITEDGLEYLVGLHALQVLELAEGGYYDSNEYTYHGYMSVTDRGLAFLGQMTNLTGLCLCHAQISDSALSQLVGMKKLRSLDLSYSTITDEGLFHVGQIASLVTLELRGCAVTDAGTRYLTNLPALKELTLDKTRVTELSVKELSAQKQLRILR